MGDFSAQAVINTILSHTFPEDPVVGEEDASGLRLPSESALRDRIVELVNQTLTAPVQDGEKAEWGLGPEHRLSAEGVLNTIDRGSYAGGQRGRKQKLSPMLSCRTQCCWKGMWTLDPIDGTKGFLRGGQYAVCLALIVDSQVELGVIGCPNLPVSSSEPDGPRGCIFFAIRGEGAYQLPVSQPFASQPIPLHIPPWSPDNLRIWQSVGHTKLTFNDEVAKAVGITLPPVSMDSQAKYCSIFRDGGIYLRLANDPNYREKIWVGCVFLCAVRPKLNS